MSATTNWSIASFIQENYSDKPLSLVDDPGEQVFSKYYKPIQSHQLSDKMLYDVLPHYKVELPNDLLPPGTLLMYCNHDGDITKQLIVENTAKLVKYETGYDQFKLPREIEILLNHVIDCSSQNQPATPCEHAPLPILVKDNSTYIFETPYMYILWVLWYCYVIRNSNPQPAWYKYIDAYIRFLLTTNSRILQMAKLRIYDNGMVLPNSCRVQSIRDIFSDTNKNSEMFISINGRTPRIVEEEITHTSYQLRGLFVPCKDFYTYVTEVIQWCSHWLEQKTNSSKNALHANVYYSHNNKSITLFEMYDYYIRHNKHYTTPQHTILFGFINIAIQNHIQLSNKVNVKIIRMINKSDIYGQFLVTEYGGWQNITDLLKKNTYQYKPTNALNKWLVSVAAEGGWHIDLEDTSRRLALWAQGQPLTSQLFTDLQQLSKQSYYHLWCSDEQIEEISKQLFDNNLTLRLQGHDRPLIVNLSEVPHHIRIHYYPRGTTNTAYPPKKIDLDLIKYHQEFPQLDLLDFLLLVEYLQRMGDQKRKTNYALINATFNSSGPIKSIRENIPNRWTSPQKLFEHLQKIPNLKETFLDTLRKQRPKGIEAYPNDIWSFIGQPLNNKGNKALPSLHTIITKQISQLAATYVVQTACNITRPTTINSQSPLQIQYKTLLNPKRKSKSQLVVPIATKPIERDLTTYSQQQAKVKPNHPFFLNTSRDKWFAYVHYFLAWLDLDNSVLKDPNVSSFLHTLKSCYKQTSPVDWTASLRVYLTVTSHLPFNYKRLLVLYMIYYQGLLCPFMMVERIANLQDKKYTLEKKVLQRVCDHHNITRRCFVTLSYTIPGELVVICYGEKGTEPFTTNIQVEDLIQGSGHPATQLWSAIFMQSRGMIPINRRTLFTTLTQNKFDIHDAFWNSELPDTQDIMFPKNDPKHANLLIENSTETDYIIVSLFLSSNRNDHHAVYKRVSELTNHSVRNFMDLALCTSGQFVETIRKRHRKRFPHRTNNGATSSYTELCNELLASQNKTVNLQIKPSQINPPPQFLDHHNQFTTKDDRAKEWLLSHYGFKVDEIPDLPQHIFTHHYAQNIPNQPIHMSIQPNTAIDVWFQSNVFRYMRDTLLTTDFILFMNDAYQLLKYINNYINNPEAPKKNTKNPLLEELLQSARDEWSRFIEHFGILKWRNNQTPIRKLHVNLIYETLHQPYTSSDNDITILVSKHNFIIQKDTMESCVHSWFDQETLPVNQQGYENVAVLAIYYLLYLLQKYQLITN